MMLVVEHVENIASSRSGEDYVNRPCLPCGDTRPILLLPERAIWLMAHFKTDC